MSEQERSAVCGYYLYFTSHCIVEAMHVHASDRKESERTAAKFFVKSNGDTLVANRGRYRGDWAGRLGRGHSVAGSVPMESINEV